MHLPSAQDMVDLIKKAGTGCYLYCRDIARAYRQLHLDPLDWALVCFMVTGKFDADINLPFGLQCAAASCQDTTGLVVRHLQGCWGHRKLGSLCLLPLNSARLPPQTIGLSSARAQGILTSTIDDLVGALL